MKIGRNCDYTRDNLPVRNESWGDRSCIGDKLGASDNPGRFILQILHPTLPAKQNYEKFKTVSLDCCLPCPNAGIRSLQQERKQRSNPGAARPKPTA
jgi:hypothetical protein